MSTFLYVFGDLVGTVNRRSAGLLLGVIGLLFASLALFGSLFLLGAPPAAPSPTPTVPSGEILVEPSPSLSSSALDAMYLEIRDRSDVATITYRLPEELGSEQGAFLVRPATPGAARALVVALSAIPGVARVESPTGSASRSGPLSLSGGVKIGLLVGLVVCLVASLIIGRLAFRRILAAFAGEIRVMRLSGTEERTILPPIIALGVLCGILAGILLVVAITVLHYVATTQPGALLHAASGLVATGRVLGVSIGGFFLGVLLGGLIGALGASLTQSRDYQGYA